MKRTKIRKLLGTQSTLGQIKLKGWIRTRRSSKEFSFLEINDGSCLKNIQVIVDVKNENYDIVEHLATGTAVEIVGEHIPSPGAGQKWEIQGSQIKVIGESPETFPLQKKRHSDEFLRTIAHLRPRTNKYGAAFRVRSELAIAVHAFFHQKGFYYIHTPILTGSDCEGAGELFQVTTLDLSNPPLEKQKINYATDFFCRQAHLTVSGQLSAEMFALALGDVYTFGPTFRAENSNTARHVSEFWMIEPEMAFCDLMENIDLGEEMIKFLIQHILDHCHDDIQLFAKFVDKQLLANLEQILKNPFVRIPYRDAIDRLKSAKHKFEYSVEYGNDLQTEHERFLTEKAFKAPVVVYDYPKSIKPFYMRVNDDGETVAAMDILIPRIGELIGGSQREERLSVLESRMDECQLPKEEYWWYLESRRFGSVPHSGFGLGFERLIMMMTGITNIRDVIPFPRAPGSLDF